MAIPGPDKASPLPIQSSQNKPSDAHIIDYNMKPDEEEQHGIRGSWCCQVGYNQSTGLKGDYQYRNYLVKKYPTSIPKSARTVSLLESLALRSPTSPIPPIGVAKWRVIDDLDPPAAMPHKARRDPLTQSAATRRAGILTGRDDETNKGETVSRIIAPSLTISASRRYVLASGESEDPMRYAPTIAASRLSDANIHQVVNTHL